MRLGDIYLLSVDNLVPYAMQPQTTKAEVINLAIIISATFAFAIIVGVLVTLGNMVNAGQF